MEEIEILLNYCKEKLEEQEDFKKLSKDSQSILIILATIDVYMKITKEVCKQIQQYKDKKKPKNKIK